MRRRALLVGVGALAAGLTGCGTGDNSGDTLPGLTLQPLRAGDEPLDVGALEGPAVINLWATWCQPCRRELPAFQEVSTQRPDVRFIGVDIAEDPSKAAAYLDELGITFEQFLDDRGELSEELGTAVLPVTIIIGADGRIATEHIGPMSTDDLHDALAAAD